MAEAASTQGRKLELVDVAARSATSQLGDAVAIRKVKISPDCPDRLEGAGIKGKCSHPELPNSLEETLPALLVQSAPSHSVPQPTSNRGTGRDSQPSSPVCNVWLWQAPGLQDGKGGLVQARGSQLESSSGTQAGSGVTLMCQKGTGSQHPQEPRGSQNAFTPAASTPRHGGLSWDGLVQSLGEVPSP